ncbi:hypothetical protein [Oleomonas cavernae]|uniref:hypothetical protein n=1 Tax=Oleomonas cavernae TaxID=2320859 RepID=UPI001F3F4093|nr:hypothetical protein [Oleomonas cavernae]
MVVAGGAGPVTLASAWALGHDPPPNPPLTGTIVDNSIAKHIITAGPWTATIAARGAELCSLTLDGQGELIWQAGAVWPRHAPNLFPIVGRLAGDALVHRGRSYPCRSTVSPATSILPGWNWGQASAARS